jgi:hypothetical protein
VSGAASGVLPSLGHEAVQSQNPASSKLSPVLGGQRIVLGQNARLKGDHLSGVFVIMSMLMSKSMRVVAMGSIDVYMAASIAQRMFMTMSVGMAVPRPVGMNVLMLVAMSLAMGVVMPMHMGVGIASAVGMNMLMLVAMSRSMGVLMSMGMTGFMGMTGAAGMNMFILMRASFAMGVVMALVIGVVVRAVFMSMVMLMMVTGVGRHIKQRRLGAVAASVRRKGDRVTHGLGLSPAAIGSTLWLRPQRSTSAPWPRPSCNPEAAFPAPVYQMERMKLTPCRPAIYPSLGGTINAQLSVHHRRGKRM